MTASVPVIRVERASKAFPLPEGGRFDAVRDISLDVLPGEIFGLVGRSGAGKSTVVELLAGLVPASRGHVTLEGRTLERAPDLRLAPQARGLGVVFQGLALFPSLSALDNVAYGLRARGVARAAAQAVLSGE